MNILISGWPGAGSSTAAKINSIILRQRYLYGGGLLKTWAMRMGYDPKTEQINKWNAKYGKYWDEIWERYIFEKIKKDDNLMIDTKLLGFFVEKPKHLMEIFITAYLQARQARAKDDKRREEIVNRDRNLQIQWIRKYKIDLFDLQQIRKNYKYIIDTSEIGIPDVAFKVFQIIRDNSGIPSSINSSRVQQEIQQIAENFGDDHEYLNKIITALNLIIKPEEIMQEMMNFMPSELFANIPPEMKKVW